MSGGESGGAARWPEPTVRLESRTGWRLRLPDGSLFLEEPSSGPGTEQISLPGDILLTLIPDDRVGHLGQVLEWSQHQAQRFVTDRGGELVAEGSIPSAGTAYACLVGFAGHTADRWIVASVGLLRDAAFLGLLILWPVTDPAMEPDLTLVRRVVNAVGTGGPDGAG